MKFEEYPVTTDDQGFRWVKNGVMVGDTECGCLTCGKPTKYIEVCSESHFCSDECVDEFYRQHDRIVEQDEILWNLLAKHRGHNVSIVSYGDPDNPADICLECEDCCEVILDAEIYTICAREDV